MFHEEVHVSELLRLPFLFPEQHQDKGRSQEIVNEVARIVDAASKQTDGNIFGRANTIENATAEIEPLIEEYFDIQPLEKLLIED